MTLRIGKRFTQQEVVDLCVEFAQDNLEKLVIRASNTLKLTPQIAKKILKKIESLPDVPYDLELSYANENDKDIYSF